jgi:hypothetical protein
MTEQINETKQPEPNTLSSEAVRPVVHRESKRDLKGPAAILAAGILGAAYLFSGNGVGRPDGRPASADSGSFSPTASEMATPNVSEAAGSPEPSAEVEIQNFTVEKLGTFEVLPGDIIAGDVAMSDSKDSAIFPLYDQDTHKAADVTDNTKTALYIDVQAPGVVYAEWGATVTRGLTAEKKAEMLRLQAVSKERAGFDKVDVVIWTGYDSTVDEAGYKADNTQGQVTENPSMNDITGGNLENLDSQSKIKVVLSIIAEGNLTPEQENVLMDILISCLCSCSNPEAPKPTPAPSSTPEACVNPSFKDHVMKAGETYKIPAGVDFIAQGDVKIDGKRTYDSNEKTGAISVVTDQKANTIFAPWGADIQVFDCSTDAFVKQTYQHDKEQLEATGRSVDKNSINQLN